MIVNLSMKYICGGIDIDTVSLSTRLSSTELRDHPINIKRLLPASFCLQVLQQGHILRLQSLLSRFVDHSTLLPQVHPLFQLEVSALGHKSAGELCVTRTENFTEEWLCCSQYGMQEADFGISITHLPADWALLHLPYLLQLLPISSTHKRT